MNTESEEFVYRLPASSAGFRPGAHRGLGHGAGMNFAAHARLFDQPDPRRLDLRASIRDVSGQWLVRTYVQPTAITVHVLLDLSTSMHFGTPGKINVAADFFNSLGVSAHGYGDAISLLPFDDTFREDLYMPPRRGRAVGALMANNIRNVRAHKTSSGPGHSRAALEAAVSRLEGASGMVFLVSDFHWSLDNLDALLDKLSTTRLIPFVIWDKSEVTPPDAGQLLQARDMETGRAKKLWISNDNRNIWLENVRRRRQELTELFARRNCVPFFLEGAFNAEKLSRYFMEQVS